METLQKKYSKFIIDVVRDIIWSQWNRLGLNGTGGVNFYSVDIEASLIAAGYGSRLDGRLYEGVWSWVNSYGSVINAERLATLICERNDEWIARLFGALLNNVDPVQWKGVIKKCKKLCTPSWKEGPLLIKSTDRTWRDKDPILSEWGIFYDRLIPKEKMQEPDTILRNNSLLRYRFLYGTVIRADVLYLLSISHHVRPKREIDFLTSVRLANRLCCHLSTIHRIQDDLESGGFIEPVEKVRKNRALITWHVKDIEFLQKSKNYDLGMVHWIKINSLLCAALDLAAKLEVNQNEDLIKAYLQQFQINYFPLLWWDNESPIPTPYGRDLGALEHHTIENLFNMVHEALLTFYRTICCIKP